MKHFLFFAVLLIGGGFTLTASAQVSGRWVDCWDRTQNRTVLCFVPDRAQPQSAPVYQRQRATTVRQDWDGGLSPYSRRPFFRYSRSTETTIIVVETNNTNYRPDIRVYTPGRNWYWPY